MALALAIDCEIMALFLKTDTNLEGTITATFAISDIIIKTWGNLLSLVDVAKSAGIATSSGLYLAHQLSG